MKFAILHCESSKKWHDMAHHFQRVFEQKGDEWKCFHAYDDGAELPDFESYKGYVITGSHSSAYDNVPWISRLTKWIQEFWKIHGHNKSENAPKLYGSCFGCQMIGNSLGGKVTRIEDDTHKILFNWDGKMIYKVEDVHTNEKFQTELLQKIKSIPSTFKIPKDLKFVESHGDGVQQLPNESTLLASSKSCNHEIFLVGTNILAVQAHPEWMPDEIERSVNEISNEEARKQTQQSFLEFREHVLSEESHHRLFMYIVREWLRT